MNTEYIRLSKQQEERLEQINQAAKWLRDGEVVAFPTETVYGLGANALSELAVERIFEAKGRPADNPLIVHLADRSGFDSIVENLPSYVDKLIERFSPGPITYVLRAQQHVPKVTTGGLSTVGVRIPDNDIARTLLQAAGCPVAAPSANTSGKPSPTKAEHVMEDLNGKIKAVIDGGPVQVGLESTVIDCTGSYPIILRPGSITKAMIETVVGRVEIDPGLTSAETKPMSPGMKYRHYAPEVPLILLPKDTNRVAELLASYQEEKKRFVLIGRKQFIEQFPVDHVVVLSDNLQDIAQHLYDYLRAYKQSDVDLILFERFETEGIGRALMDRLQKAASEY